MKENIKIKSDFKIKINKIRQTLQVLGKKVDIWTNKDKNINLKTNQGFNNSKQVLSRKRNTS